MTRVVRADRVGLARVGLVAPADLAVLARVDPVVPADLTNIRADPAGLVAPVVPTSTRADRVVLADPDTQVDPVAQADRVVPAGPAALGTAMDSVATSTAPRGATGLARGDMARRPVRRGTVHSRRQGDPGTTARSTTTATRRRQSGIPGSTSSASTSSESGSRCKPVLTTPASPLGEAGVVLFTARPARPADALYTSGVKQRETGRILPALVKSP